MNGSAPTNIVDALRLIMFSGSITKRLKHFKIGSKRRNKTTKRKKPKKSSKKKKTRTTAKIPIKEKKIRKKKSNSGNGKGKAKGKSKATTTKKTKKNKIDNATTLMKETISPIVSNNNNHPPNQKHKKGCAGVKHAYRCYALANPQNFTYIGITNNLENRLRKHNGLIKGGARRTRGRGPWKIAAYAYGFKDKHQSLSYEWFMHHKHRSCQNKVSIARRLHTMRSFIEGDDRFKHLNLRLKRDVLNEKCTPADQAKFCQPCKRFFKIPH